MCCEVMGFWGKVQVGDDGAIGQWLSLAQHSLDVAAVFAALAELPTIHRRLEASAGGKLDKVQRQRLAVLALLHDVGKANLGFQGKAFDKTLRIGHIRELAVFFSDANLQERLAQALEAETICGWFEPPESALAFLVAAWSHHGKPRPEFANESRQADHKTLARYWQADGERDPFQAIADLLQAAKSRFPAAFGQDAPPIPATPALQHRFAGLLMLADWLGSHRQFFPLQNPEEPAPRRSPDDAALALRAVGLDPRHWQADLANNKATFNERFGLAPHLLPSALQTHLDKLPTDDAQSRLLIAEAETGSGKTEAALARFFRLFAAGEVDALYFALPTRVAARELYQRVDAAIGRLFPDPDNRPPTLLAVPGYARVDNVAVERLLPASETLCHDEGQARRERVWAAEHPKRFLAATVAVGTIDQALLSALQTPHAHLRSVCLDRSLLVVDEVHASDPYMRRLLHGLLDHHLGLGGHALLLSATLGSRARAAFTKTGEPGLEAAAAAPYPAVTDAKGIPQAMPGDAKQGKSVRVEQRPCLEKPESLLPDIAAALKAGARALVVLNTVGRAIALHKLAEADPDMNPYLFQCAGVIAPHHGRFAPVDRELLDEAVTKTLGKNSPDGARLLIGTQTLEQSLDIDADLLITDLCPMDVLLQRIGRLQRHRNRPRPTGFGQARCLLLVPETEDLASLLDGRGIANGTAKRAGLGSVYPDMRVLQLTRDLLAQQPDIEIPRDNRRLVEGATHSTKLSMLTGERWDKHGREVEGGDLAKGIRAHYVGLAALYRLPFGDVECQFRENEEARTRLGLDGLRVPLSQTVPSPFGQSLTEITIPGHLADKNATALQAEVTGSEGGEIVLTYGTYRYRYSRHGLEKLDG